MSLKLFEFLKVGKEFQSKTVLENLSFGLNQSEFLTLLGPSGCGKSTILKLISGLEPISQGKIEWKESLKRFETSFVFQEAQLLPWRNARQNIELPLEFAGISNEHRKLRALEALKEVGLESAKDLYPHQLSGGMKMRVSLARALVTEPKLLLLDEPFAALDEVTRMVLDADLRGLAKKLKMTVIFVTHSLSEAAFLSDRIILFSKKTLQIHKEFSVPFTQNRTQDLRNTKSFSDLVQELYKEFRCL